MKKSKTLPFAPLFVLAALALFAPIGAMFASGSMAQSPPSHDTRSHEAHALPVTQNYVSENDASSHAVLDHAAFKKMMESGWPSAEKNLVLAKLTGEWRYKAAFWAAPDDKPKWTKGVFRNEMTLDSRYLSASFVGKLNIGGHDAMVKGQGLIGYDNARREYSSVWVDTLTTSMTAGFGKYDSEKRELVETGEFTNPLTGAVSKFRSELQFVDDDDYKRTIYAVDKSGKETRLIEFDCTKRP
jgi:hypothetical protein